MKTAVGFVVVLLAVLVAHDAVAGALLTCGTSFTTPCLAATDIRYANDASDALADQANIWKISHGLFLCEGNDYHFLDGLLLTAQNRTHMFLNQSVIGSRFYNHGIEIIENAEGGGGGDPDVAPFDFYSTSSYERDGRAVSLGSQYGFSTEPFQLDYKVEPRNFRPSRGRPRSYSRRARFQFVVDAYTVHYSAVEQLGEPDVETVDNMVVNCLDDNCSSYMINLQMFLRDNGNSTHLTTLVHVCEKTDLDSWNQALMEAFEKYKVPQDQRVPVPMRGQCFTGACPTEEDWCNQDPVCSVSPYQEPEPSLSIEIIVSFGMGFVMVLFGVITLYIMATKHKRSAANATGASPTDDETEGDMTDDDDDSAPVEEHNSS